MEKIFCIGFQKTATSSLCAALEYLGYKVKGFEVITNRTKIKRRIKECIGKYNAMRDMPWPIMFKWIDKEFPESKFIFTVREEEKWIRSVKNHFGGEKKNSMRKWIYGVSDPLEDEEKYISRYRKHNEEVRDYFKGRFGKDIIEMDITKGDGWSKICSFLEIKEPIFQFPNTNVSTKREIEMGMKEWLLWRMDQIPRKIVKHYRQERLIKSILTWFKSGEIRNAINKGIRKAFYDR